MEIRISRILSEYYDYTRKESEELIRQGRVTCNGAVTTIGDKSKVNDVVELDGVRVPLKGIFRKVEREHAEKEEGSRYGSLKDENEYELSPKDRSLRKGRKGGKTPKKKGKLHM